MLYEYISALFGIIKILFFKTVYFNRIKFKGIPKVNNSIKLAIKRKSHLVLGKNFRSRNNVSFRVYNKGTIKIGDNCFFNDGCSVNCQKNINIGNNVIFGQNVLVFDHDHDYKNSMDNYIREPVIIGNNVWIGANTIILKGVTIGDNVVIGAGSIITKNIDSNKIITMKTDYKIREIEK